MYQDEGAVRTARTHRVLDRSVQAVPQRTVCRLAHKRRREALEQRARALGLDKLLRAVNAAVVLLDATAAVHLQPCLDDVDRHCDCQTKPRGSENDDVIGGESVGCSPVSATQEAKPPYARPFHMLSDCIVRVRGGVEARRLWLWRQVSQG